MKIVVIIFSIFLCFCTRQGNRTINTIDLLDPETNIITKLSEIATDIDYVPFQTTDSSLISSISLLKVKGNFLYIGTSDNIFCFDNSGKFLFKLDKRGRGPGEYVFLKDFDINFNSTILAILSRSSILLYKQTKNGFIFLNKLSFPTSPSKINFIDNANNLMLQYSNQDGKKPFSKEIVSIEGISIKVWPNYLKYTLKDGSITVLFYENISFWSQNRLLVKELQNDTLFRLTEMNTLEPFLIFDTNDNRLTPEARSNGKYYSDHMNEYFHLTKIFGSKSYVYYTYYYKNVSEKVIYDQISKTKYRVPYILNLQDDISGGVSFEPQYCDNGLFYTWIDVFSLKEFLSSDVFKNTNVKNPEKKEKLKKLADSLSEFDNPVLIIAKIK